MTVSLTIVPIECEYIHLLFCLLDKFVRDRALDSRNDKLVELLLYIGLDTTLHDPSVDVVYIS